jgi:RNA ligase (TIGR02306 family)
MAQRNGQLFSHQPFRWLMRRDWGKKLLFIFFGRKKDKKSGWPSWVSKTDEERIQNIPHILEDKSEWIATEKIDGTSTTATYRKTGKRKHDYFICSRNVVFDKPDKNCYYDTNVYTEMSEKYHFEDVLADIVEKNNLEWATLQGETYGAGIQKRDYGMKGHDFAGFNLIFSDRGRLNSVEAKAILAEYGIPWVPIVHEHFVLPDTVDELLDEATGISVVDGGMREGLVFRSQDGTKSFKAVSNEFLLRFHQ